MAVACKSCGQDVLGPECVKTIIRTIDGRGLNPIRCGSEFDFDAESNGCADCGVAVGSFHHWGCDQEECPRCGQQLITCGCAPDRMLD